MNDATDRLRPSPEDPEEAREFGLLIEPEFVLTLNHIPTQSGIVIGERLRDHGASLMFRTIKPTRSYLYVDFYGKTIDIQIYAQVAKLIDDGSINSWRDLYGSELIIEGPYATGDQRHSEPAGTRITRCTLSFSTGSQFASRFVEVPVTDINDRLKLLPHPYINYVCILKEAELGPKPVLLHCSA